MGHFHSDDNNKNLFGVTALAAGIGAVTALLLSNRSGTQTRQIIRSKVQDLKDKMYSTKDDIADVTEDAKTVAKQAKAEVMDKSSVKTPTDKK